MWFKNLQIYRLMQTFTIDKENLHRALEQKRIRTCSQLERQTLGWMPPLGIHHDSLVHTSNGYAMLAAAKREKILPMSVVREQAAELILTQERQESRQLSKRERRTVIDEVTLRLLPQALSRTTITYAYIDNNQQLLLIDTASQKRADEFIELLREGVKELPLVLPQLAVSIRYTLTQWLLYDSCPPGFSIDDFCELQQPDKERALIKCQHRDVTSESIRTHLTEGMEVIQLGMVWKDRISFVLDHQFTIKRIKFLELVTTEMDDDMLESPETRFDADFNIFAA